MRLPNLRCQSSRAFGSAGSALHTPHSALN
jgi:hypothetical protein